MEFGCYEAAPRPGVEPRRLPRKSDALPAAPRRRVPSTTAANSRFIVLASEVRPVRARRGRRKREDDERGAGRD